MWISTGTQTFGAVPTSTDAAPSPVQILFDLSQNQINISGTCVPGTCPVYLIIKVDTTSVDGSFPSKGTSGEGFRFAITSGTDVAARGMTSGQRVYGEPIALHEFTLYRSVPTVVTTPGVTNQITGNGVYELFKFTVNADQKGPIGAYKFSFEIANTGVTLSNLELFDSGYTSGPVAKINSIVLTPPVVNQGPYGARLLFDTDESGILNGGEFREIPAGSSRTYTLKASVSGYHATQINAVTTKLLGDSQFPSPVTACAGETYGNNACHGIDAQEHDHFIWTDFNYTVQYNTSTATNTAEWTNGFRVKGLAPASAPQSI